MINLISSYQNFIFILQITQSKWICNGLPVWPCQRRWARWRHRVHPNSLKLFPSLVSFPCILVPSTEDTWRDASKPHKERGNEEISNEGIGMYPLPPVHFLWGAVNHSSRAWWDFQWYGWVGQGERFNSINCDPWENCDTVANYTWDLTHNTGCRSIMCCHAEGIYLMYLMMIIQMICIMCSNISGLLIYQSCFEINKLFSKKLPYMPGLAFLQISIFKTFLCLQYTKCFLLKKAGKTIHFGLCLIR